MQLVPLSADGRVDAVGCAVPAPAALRVALQPDRDGVGLVALGSAVAGAVGRLGATDAAAYAPVLRLLWARGQVGTCAAQVTADGGLVLDLAPAPDCVFANSPGDLVLLAAEHTVPVTRDEQYQDVLANRGARVVVALTPCTISTGEDAERGVEVGLDGCRVGELTGLAAQHYLPVVDEVVARGGRAGCEALMRPDDRGPGVELRLPAVDAPSDDAVAAPVQIACAPMPDMPSTAVPPHEDPALPTVDPGPPSIATSPARPRRGRQVGVGVVAVVGVLVLAAAMGHGVRNSTPTVASSVADVTPARAPSATSPATAAIDATTTSAATSTGPTSTATRAPRTGITAAGGRAGGAVAPSVSGRSTATRTPTSKSSAAKSTSKQPPTSARRGNG